MTDITLRDGRILVLGYDRSQSYRTPEDLEVSPGGNTCLRNCAKGSTLHLCQTGRQRPVYTGRIGANCNKVMR